MLVEYFLKISAKCEHGWLLSNVWKIVRLNNETMMPYMAKHEISHDLSNVTLAVWYLDLSSLANWHFNLIGNVFVMNILGYNGSEWQYFRSLKTFRNKESKKKVKGTESYKIHKHNIPLENRLKLVRNKKITYPLDIWWYRNNLAPQHVEQVSRMAMN